MVAPVGVGSGRAACAAPSTPTTPAGWVAYRYHFVARLRAGGFLPPGPGGGDPGANNGLLKGLTHQAAPNLEYAARLAGEPPPAWPNGIPGVLTLPYLPADPPADFPADGLIIKEHPITGEPLPRRVVLDGNGNLEALPDSPRDEVLELLEPFLAGLPDGLAHGARRTTRRLLFDPALFDPDDTPGPVVLARFKAALTAVPPLDPAKPEPWKRAVERAWPTALSLPLTVRGIRARFKAAGEALGVPQETLDAGCRLLRARRLKPNDHGAVARWVKGLHGLNDAPGWTRYARIGWGRARTASVSAQDRSRRKVCGRLTYGDEGGQRQRCGTHGCGHPDCAPRQSALAREKSWPHALAWADAGVSHVRFALTLPRRGDWTPIDALDALAPCAARVVHELAQRLDCRLAARIAVERQADGAPEWVIILTDVDGELTRSMLAEDAAYMACNQYAPPSTSPTLLAARTRAVTNAGIRTADLWPDLTREAQAAANAAAVKAGIAWEVTYLAPVYNLEGTWSDAHKSAQAVGHDWPHGFRRFRSSRGTTDGLVLPYAAAFKALGRAPTTRQEALEQARSAADRADADEAVRTLEEAPEFPRGQGEAKDAAEAAREVANDAATEAEKSYDAARAARRDAEDAAHRAHACTARAEAAARAAELAEAIAAPLRRAADRAARCHDGPRDDIADAQAHATMAADSAAAQARRAAESSVAEARAARAQAETAARHADAALTAAALDDMDADHLVRRARRLEQIAHDAPARAALAQRRAVAEALLDGPLPVGRPVKLTGCWSPCAPRREPDEDEDEDEAPQTPVWTLTKHVKWLRRVGPPGMKILGRVGIDGEIASFRLVPPPPQPSPTVFALFDPAPLPSPAVTFDLTCSLTEDPASRLDCVRARLQRTRRMTPTRPLGLPRDLAPFADPRWAALPTDRLLTDADIDEVLRRYVFAAVRRATTTTGARCSAGFPVADAATWRAAAISHHLVPGASP